VRERERESDRNSKKVTQLVSLFVCFILLSSVTTSQIVRCRWQVPMQSHVLRWRQA